MKYIFTSIITALALTSCTITPEQATQLQDLDKLIHTAGPYLITVKSINK